MGLIHFFTRNIDTDHPLVIFLVHVERDYAELGEITRHAARIRHDGIAGICHVDAGDQRVAGINDLVIELHVGLILLFSCQILDQMQILLFIRGDQQAGVIHQILLAAYFPREGVPGPDKYGVSGGE
ncbi:hypothetical protein D3C77_574480 [compost metagenome]